MTLRRSTQTLLSSALCLWSCLVFGQAPHAVPWLGAPAPIAPLRASGSGPEIVPLPPVEPPRNLDARVIGPVLPIDPNRLHSEQELDAWWREMVRAPLGDPREALDLDLNLAVIQALKHSAHLQVLRDTAMISSTAVERADANFDALGFAESRFTDTSEPVGNLLTTGGAPRFIDETWYASAGLKRRTLSGAQLEASQRSGYQNTNSLYFVPNNQATARLNLSLTQPLLRGRGTTYNNSVVVLATLDSRIAHDDFQRDMQAYLVQFHKAFWDLYLQRVVLVQRRRLVHEAKLALAELEARQNVDVVGNQLARARAALASREATLARFSAGVQNAVSRFKSLVNDPFLDDSRFQELIPLDPPDAAYGDSDLTMALKSSLENRPEIHRATRELQAAGTRLDVSKQDLLPVLNLVLGSYVSGLQGNSDLANAYANQFTQGRPTYWGGLVFEKPLGNRASRSTFDQRNLEMRRAVASLRAVTANVRAEVEIAVREVATTYREMLSEHQAMLAEQQAVEFLIKRWRILADDQQVAGVVFNDLLDAQDRRAAAELEFVSAQVAHRIAWIELKRVTGTLCDCQAITNEEIRLPGPVPAGEPVSVPPGQPDASAMSPRPPLR